MLLPSLVQWNSGLDDLHSACRQLTHQSYFQYILADFAWVWNMIKGCHRLAISHKSLTSAMRLWSLYYELPAVTLVDLIVQSLCFIESSDLLQREIGLSKRHS